MYTHCVLEVYLPATPVTGTDHWWNWWKNVVSAFLFKRSPVSWLVREVGVFALLCFQGPIFLGSLCFQRRPGTNRGRNQARGTFTGHLTGPLVQALPLEESKP